MYLLVTPPGAPAPAIVSLHRALTTVGSSSASDLRISGLAAQWAVAQKDPSGVTTLCVLSSGERVALGVDQPIVVDGVGVHISMTAPTSSGEGLPVAWISEALVHVESAPEALAGLLERLMVATASEAGAFILRDKAGYQVALSRTANNERLAAAESLLSDTIVTEVLRTGEMIVADNLPGNSRYQSVPSVVNMQLTTVLCVPMTAGAQVFGALYLGARAAAGHAFSERCVDQTLTIASMAVPFLAQLRRRRDTQVVSGELVGESSAMHGVRDMIAKLAPIDLSVLVTGPTGTGKELVARALHSGSARSSQPLIAINCAAIPEGVLESELFGHAKGAFTGATGERVGKLEAADGSTLFLDEIGDMPLPMQASLLRVLQDREVTRIGENHPRPVDFRVIAATHRDLDGEAAAGRFRQDLLFRLREVTIALPPLHQRGGDIELLATLFLRQAENELGLCSHSLAQDALQALLDHDWPGNVRELRALMRRVAVLSDDSVIRAVDLQLAPRRAGMAAPKMSLDRTLAQARDEFLRDYVLAVYDAHHQNREATAAALGVSLRSLYRYLQ